MKKCLSIVLMLVVLSGCDKLGFSLNKGEDQKLQERKEVPAPKPTLKDKTDPAWNSYGITLPLMAIQQDEVEITAEPETDGTVKPSLSSDLFASLKPAVGNCAYMSTNRYEVEAPNMLTVRPLDESAVIGDTIPNPADLPVGDATAVWKNPVNITAGPIACLNGLIIADSEPSIVVLDPVNLQLIKRFPVKSLIVAFTGFFPERAELSVLHADYWIARYRFINETPPLEDPVTRLIGPSTEALEKIIDKTGKLLSGYDTIQFDRTNVFPIASEIDVTKPKLFRITVDDDGAYRIYPDGIGDIPFLLILFNEAGESIFSNIEYAAEKVLEQNLEKNAVYYLVVSLFPDNQANQTLQDRTVKLVVKPK